MKLSIACSSILVALSLLSSQTKAFVPSAFRSSPSVPQSFTSLASEQTNSLLEKFTATSKVTTEKSGPTAKDYSVQGAENSDYQKGFLTISFITFLNASTNPMWHAVSSSGYGPPALFLNAAIAVIALVGLLAGKPLMEAESPSSTDLAPGMEPDNVFGGMELGFWKFLGTSCHVFGLSLTTADHGAFLIQLTTLIVPVIQALQGEKIPRQIQLAIALALGGVFLFTQDPGAATVSAVQAQNQAIGDAFCVGAAIFYSAYDIQTFKWGKIVPRPQLVTTKVATQAMLSIALCAGLAWSETSEYFASNPSLNLIVPVVLWSGLIVNALATFLQVAGMQSVGPTRAQTIFASQPLWSSILAYIFLHETIGAQGAAGGGAFLSALFLAANAPKEEASKEASP